MMPLLSYLEAHHSTRPKSKRFLERGWLPVAREPPGIVMIPAPSSPGPQLMSKPCALESTTPVPAVKENESCQPSLQRMLLLSCLGDSSGPFTLCSPEAK